MDLAEKEQELVGCVNYRTPMAFFTVQNSLDTRSAASSISLPLRLLEGTQSRRYQLPRFHCDDTVRRR